MKVCWSTSSEIEAEYLEIEVNPGLGILVIQDSKDESPKLIFCSLFSDPERTFFEGLDQKKHGISVETMKSIISLIEQKLSERPL